MRRWIEGQGWATILFEEELRTAEMEVSSAELLAVADTPVELVPAPGEDIAILPFVIVGIYTAGGTPYTHDGALDVTVGLVGLTVASFNNLITGAVDGVAVSIGNDGQMDRPDYENQPLLLVSSENPTLGDGTLKISIGYLLISL